MESMNDASSHLHAELLQRAESELNVQRHNLEAFVENMNEGLRRETCIMLFGDDPTRLHQGMADLVRVQERASRSAARLFQLDDERDRLDFSYLPEHYQRNFTLRRRALARVTAKLEEQLEEDERVLRAFNHLVERMQTKLDFGQLLRAATDELNNKEADAFE